ncbi:hypothetical protein Tco_0953041 [Tanacetum coccineum]|uniref:Uncharacterized protein n=1 Tax=Tanacetum coccineum TaxID=301880 RepID=A0ABQ5E1M1_9ASTR
MWSQTSRQIRQIHPRGESRIWEKKRRRKFYAFATVLRESARDVLFQKEDIDCCHKVGIVKMACYKHLDWITVEGMMMLSTSSRRRLHRLRIQDIEEICCFFLCRFMDPVTLCTTPSQTTQVRKILFDEKLVGDTIHFIDFSLRRVNSFTMKMEILLESTSNKLMGRYLTDVAMYNGGGVFPDPAGSRRSP